MKTKSVEFVKSHPLFAHEVGEVAELRDEDAKALIDSGHAVAHAGKEKADATKDVESATLPSVSEKAVEAATGQRAEAHATGETVHVGIAGAEGDLPVGTEPDGTKVLIRPEDEAIAKREADAKKAKK